MTRKINLFITTTEFAACIILAIYLLLTNVMAHRNDFNTVYYQEVDKRVRNVITNRSEFKWVDVTGYCSCPICCGSIS